MKAVYPLHHLDEFTRSPFDSGLYVSHLSDHVNSYNRFLQPHKHDFYFVLLVLEGHGNHEIDFKTYNIRAGSVCFISPGQLHRLLNCIHGEGYVLLHSRDYYEVSFNNRSLRDFPFYFCSGNPPVLDIKGSDNKKMVISYFEELLREFKGDEPGRHQRCCSLIDLIYITLSREYQKVHPSPRYGDATPHRIRQLEDLIGKHFTRLKSPADYARLMKMTTRQLNRMCREALGKTTSELIIDRVLLEAKRSLLHHEKNVAGIAEELGYYDTGYFTRLFRKKTGLTPSGFARKYSSAMELT